MNYQTLFLPFRKECKVGLFSLEAPEATQRVRSFMIETQLGVLMEEYR